MRRDIFARLLLTVLICLIILAMGEVYCRLFMHYNMHMSETMNLNKVIRNSKIPGLLYELKPNSSSSFYGEQKWNKIEINSFGFRGHEYSFKKPNNCYRIVVLGDSVGFGWGVDNEEVFSILLEGQLNTSSRDSRTYEVLNFSVPGYNIEQEYITLYSKCIKFAPDCIIVITCGNDFFRTFNYYRPSLLCYVPFAMNLKLIRFLVQRVAHAADVKRWKEVHRMRRIGDLKRMIEFSENKKIDLLFYGPPDWYRELIEKISRRNLIIEREFPIHEDVYTIPDGHPNALGHKKIMLDIYNFLIEYLKVSSYK